MAALDSNLTRSRLPGEAAKLAWSARVRGFADGFGGTLAGALAGCVAVEFLSPGRFEHLWLPLIAMPVAFGSFEVWRIQRVRSPSAVVARLALLFLVSLVAWWIIASAWEIRIPVSKPAAPQNRQERV